MSLFDSLAGSLLGSIGTGGAHPGLVNEVLGMIGGGQGGGLPGLVRSFESQGLGNLIASWISTGKNLPISADQIASVLGRNQVHQLAAKFGIAPEEVAERLTQLLPQVINGLTPHGSVPDSDALQEGLSLLRSRLGA
jgi:uncharacterized protein YidB (DUF937 family)